MLMSSCYSMAQKVLASQQEIIKRLNHSETGKVSAHYGINIEATQKHKNSLDFKNNHSSNRQWHHQAGHIGPWEATLTYFHSRLKYALLFAIFALYIHKCSC